ncbi:MAG: transposase [Haloquadratum walsbyi J07HQW2]|uniref:Transposase n=2 Tax=Haloquadratum walsbyi TaxID=293091 RepID=U1NFM8_9EURY|nr:MAG: transposase [Haloquadratum walsbyi J07HQW2]
MNQKNWEFKNKLAQYYTAHHKAVFLEDVNVREMLKGSQNARSKAESGAASSVFSNTMVKNGCYVVTVNPENTTLDCALCGTSVYKRLSVRERSCPTCGFETGRGGAGRDWNAALNVLSRGLKKRGVGVVVIHSEETPVGSVIAVSADNGKD